MTAACAFTCPPPPPPPAPFVAVPPAPPPPTTKMSALEIPLGTLQLHKPTLVIETTEYPFAVVGLGQPFKVHCAYKVIPP